MYSKRCGEMKIHFLSRKPKVGQIAPPRTIFKMTVGTKVGAQCLCLCKCQKRGRYECPGAAAISVEHCLSMLRNILWHHGSIKIPQWRTTVEILKVAEISTSSGPRPWPWPGIRPYLCASLIDFYRHTKFHSNLRNFLWTDVRTDRQTLGFIRS